jgi:hypothetical protein
MRRATDFWQTHPSVRDAVLWAIPAILAGAVLRAMLLSYSPYAYWGSDSESYFNFTFRLLNEGAGSIQPKRRYIYPLLLLPVSLLPGSPLKWLAWVQHLMGLLTLIPLAYCIRKIFRGWKWFIVPVTLVYAGFPILIWYEHELLAEAFFFYSLVWAFAGWVAWQSRAGTQGAKAAALWWLFLVPFALCVLTKPAGRFFWPGVLVGLVYARAWRHLRWYQWLATAAVLVMSLTVGDKFQASRLLYSSAFPLTQLESPLHADLKAEMGEIVRDARANLDAYYIRDNEVKSFLRGGFEATGKEAWVRLKSRGDSELHGAMCEMALEAIRAEPHLYAYLVVSRTAGALNPSMFKTARFNADYFAVRYESLYETMAARGGRRVALVNRIFGYPKSDALPPFDEIARRVSPNRSSATADALRRYADAFNRAGWLTTDPSEGGKVRPLRELRPTWLGWWMIASLLVCLVAPWYRDTLGVWWVIVIGYAFGVHLVGSSNPRFFAPALFVLCLALAAPLDAVLRAAVYRKREKARS